MVVKELTRKAKIFFSCFITVLGLGFITSIVAQAGVADVSETIYNTYYGQLTFYDSNSGCYIYQTYDVKASTNNYYRTFGLEFSRVKPDVNPMEYQYASAERLSANDPHVYIDKEDFPINQSYSVDGYQRQYVIINMEDTAIHKEWRDVPGTEHEINTYVIEESYVFEMIGSVSQEWLTEVQTKLNNNEKAYVGVDCIIAMHWNGIPSGRIRPTGEFYRQLYDWSNWEELLSIGWGNPQTAAVSIPSHYNSYLELGGDFTVALEPETSGEDITSIPEGSMMLVKNEKTSETNIESGNGDNQSGDNYAAPDIRTYNTSNEFDLWDAIPTTESYTNGIDIDAWYGHVNITKRSVQKTYAIPYNLRIKDTQSERRYGIDTVQQSDLSGQVIGNRHYVSCTTRTYGTMVVYQNVYWVESEIVTYYTKTGTIEYTMDPAVYYYISGINMYEYANSTVKNDFSNVRYSTPSSVSYNISVSGETASTGSNLSSTVFSANDDYHVIWPDLSDIEVNNQNLTSSELDPNSSIAIDNYVSRQAEMLISGRVPEVKNDVLTIDGHTYMDENNLYVDFISNSRQEMSSTSNDKVQEEDTVMIPQKTPNGYYYHTLEAKYSRIMAGSAMDVRKFELVDDETTKHAIKLGYEINEPICVHSPVVAPFQIKGEYKTQLVNQSHLTQLILDNTYTLKFDWNTYFDQKGYTPISGFTQYVETKLVRFPFAVSIDGTYYEPIAENGGYTNWINLGVVEEIDFYVPSWADEGYYGMEGYDGYNNSGGPVQCMVYANNSTVINNMEEYEYNSSLNSYVATYDYPLEISGVIYDFKITGVNDEFTFGGYTELDTGIYSFVANKQEKRVGTANRFGESSIRYTLDGTLTTSWPLINTVPLTSGSSNYYEQMGYLKKGHTIGFTVKTISRLNGTADTIQIKPTYRYVAPNGEIKDNIDVYYNKDSTYFIPMYSDYDSQLAKNNKVRIADEYFEYAYYDYDANADYSLYGPYSTVQYTADKYDKEYNTVFYTETESYSVGGITLYSTQKLLTGNEEELYVNRNNAVAEVLRYRESNGLGDISASVYDKFQSSMQTWYGEYTIPGEIFVVEKNPSGSTYENKHEEVMATDGYTSEDADYWLDGGYLILNFEIVTYVDGQYEHLAYYGGANGTGLNMWDTESTNDPDEVDVWDVYDIDDIPIRDGDVAIISLDSNLNDRYKPGILYAN